MNRTPSSFQQPCFCKEKDSRADGTKDTSFRVNPPQPSEYIGIVSIRVIDSGAQ